MMQQTLLFQEGKIPYVWPENILNYTTMVLTAFEVYKTENKNLNQNKTVTKQMEITTKQMEIVYIIENVFKHATIAGIIF